LVNDLIAQKILHFFPKPIGFSIQFLLFFTLWLKFSPEGERQIAELKLYVVGVAAVKRVCGFCGRTSFFWKFRV
jgi:hypothetical protein